MAKSKVSNLIKSILEQIVEQTIPVTQWQREAPTVWFHGSPYSDLTVLSPGMPKAHVPYNAMYGVYLSDSKEAARIFGVNVYEVTILSSDKYKLFPDPDIQTAEEGTYVAAVFQGRLNNVRQIVKSTKYTPPLVLVKPAQNITIIK